MTTLLDMVSIHIPVLAGELIELLDPQPGAVAVDCTIGGGGHARLVADRIGPAGTLIGIDRDPIAEERFAELAAEVSCATRFIRADFASGLEQLRAEGIQADLVYMDLGMSSMQVDTWERGFSYAYDAPLDMRMDPEQELSAADVVNAWDVLGADGRLAAISFHSLEDRRVKRFLAERARGCICPPDLPVCACGREPEAELLTRKSVAPTPGEVEANPRSKSARLRAARKL
jgi:16S rRNA C1402 N4-methylase RsmH